MSKASPPLPPTRSWRDISQPVKARAMSGGGRWRLVRATLRVAGIAAAVATVGWGAWQVRQVLRHGPKEMPAAMKTPPLKDVLLTTDGVLEHPWVVEKLALPKGISLLELDLKKLQERLLAVGQVRTANLTLNVPDTLAVTISERSPVARIRAAFPDGQLGELLVARDGVVFHGVAFDPEMVATLPWLEGISLARKNGEFLPIFGMETTSDLLVKAKLEVEQRYLNWEVISLARLYSDGEIEVRTRQGTRITFGIREDFFRQLARLDLLLDTVAEVRPDKRPVTIDLSLGSDVPVTIAAAPLDSGDRAGLPLLRPSAAHSFPSILPQSQIKLKREL